MEQLSSPTGAGPVDERVDIEQDVHSDAFFALVQTVV